MFVFSNEERVRLFGEDYADMLHGLATIVYRTKMYTLSDEDVLWACRMVIGEGYHDVNEVLWCMTQRFMRLYGRTNYRTFTQLIQAYSQPINPKWRRDGVFCRPGGRSHEKDSCNPKRLERRDVLAKATIPSLQKAHPAYAEVIQHVFSWAQGFSENTVPGAIHFAVPSIVSRQPRNYASFGPADYRNRLLRWRNSSEQREVAKHNWFMAIPSTHNKWHENTVAMHPAQALSVEEAQWILVSLGYELGDYGDYGDGVDGYWGNLSRSAMERFERDRGIEVDGEFDGSVESDILVHAYVSKFNEAPDFEGSALDRAGVTKH